jgi:acetyl-CoA synthetase
VRRLAGALAAAGIKKGDVVAIYLPMIPEAFYAIFACSKIGAVYATIFQDFLHRRFTLDLPIQRRNY